MMKRMYEPLEETKCAKCGRVIATPEEVFDVVNGDEAVRYRVKYSS